MRCGALSAHQAARELGVLADGQRICAVTYTQTVLDRRSWWCSRLPGHEMPTAAMALPQCSGSAEVLLT